MQKSSVNVYAGICKWLKRGAFLQKSIVLKIGKLLHNLSLYTFYFLPQLSISFFRIFSYAYDNQLTYPAAAAWRSTGRYERYGNTDSYRHGAGDRSGWEWGKIISDAIPLMAIFIPPILLITDCQNFWHQNCLPLNGIRKYVMPAVAK